MKKVSAVLRVFLIIVLTVLLSVSLVLTSVTLSIRLALTPENVYRTMEQIDYAAIQLPDGYGGFTTITEMLEEPLGAYGIQLTESDVNELIRMMSADDIVAVIVQDFRAWLMDYGPVPNPDPYELADIALSGMDRDILAFLGMLSDPREVMASFLWRITELADLDQRLEALEPVRDILSKGTVIFEGSVCLLFALLILVLSGMKMAPALTAVSLAVSGCGAAMLFGPALLNGWKNYLLASLRMPESTFDIMYLPLTDSIRSTGSWIALTGLTVFIFTAVIWVFSSMIRRERELAEKIRLERMQRFEDFGNS